MPTRKQMKKEFKTNLAKTVLCKCRLIDVLYLQHQKLWRIIQEWITHSINVLN